MLETAPKKQTGLKKMPIIKNPQFYSELLKIQAILPTHGLVILAKFHNDWEKIAHVL